jgi:starch phosphorylase
MSAKTPAQARRAKSDLFDRVRQLATNLHWSWSQDAQRLFAALHPALWDATNHDPLATLAKLPAERREELAGDRRFGALLETCESELARYLRAPGWFGRAHAKDRRLWVAYFCSEFAIHESLPQYSGGLGVLAGDHIKTASDLGLALVGVGLLYRSGYFQQSIEQDGTQLARYPRYDYANMPIEDTRKTVRVPLAGRMVIAKIWKLTVGRTCIFLLDADHARNRPADRQLTHSLYGGGPESRLQQQVLLGVGGHRALDALGIKATVFHLNEGHAAFCGLDRVRKLVAGGASPAKAIAKVRASSVFTTHTPVPAGHDRYEPKLVAKYLKPIADEIGFARDELLALGREDPLDREEWFCMTVVALKLSAHCNGVAKLHGDTSRRMWQSLFKTKSPSRVPIGHVTNGIHSQSWLAPQMTPLYRKYLRPKWLSAGPDHDPWSNADRIPPNEFWTARCLLRKRLVHFVRGHLLDRIRAGGGDAAQSAKAYEAFDETALTIGFARRFATYKRAPLVFHDTVRLARVLGDPHRPVQLVFAGKAHPADKPGQAFVRQVCRHAQSAGFRGRVVMIENYDMHIGRMLTSGCDVWLNTPRRPNEASGTSGMKPPLHGGLNCSILDGWWPEGYNGRNGWVIGGKEFKSQRAQDKFDAESLYEILESQLVPTFFQRGRDGVPRRWVKLMAESMKSVCAKFGTNRMLGEYVEKYYLPAHTARPEGTTSRREAGATGVLRSLLVSRSSC